MKKLAILVALFTGSLITHAQIDYPDRSEAPKPGPAPKPEIGKYEQFKLDNGLTVFLVENHKLPRVTFQLVVDNDPVLEGDKAGYVRITGEMMESGTTNRTKEELNEEIDFIGASLSAGPNGIYASSLSKHKDKIMELISDVALNPAFPQSEMEKVKTKIQSELQSAKNDPNSIASTAGSAIRYGKDHPYGEVMTEETLENITMEDCKAYFNTYFRPNKAYLAIVGDITLEEAKELTKKYLSSWEAGDVPEHSYELPAPPKANRVAFVDKPGAVQSVVNVTYPVDLKPGTEDALHVSVMNNILGAPGFSGRFMQNLREDKAFTYGAYSSFGTSPVVGSFRAYASVRNEVTDSAITEFLYEMERMVSENVTEADLEKTIAKMSGSFARSLERPQTLASFALNIARYGLPSDYYDTYLERLSNVTIEDVRNAAKKYVKPENAIIFVVGNKEEVAPNLEQFAASGNVEFFDNYGDPAKEIRPVPEGVTAESIYEKYIEALGGRSKLEKVKSLYRELSMEVAGAPMALTMISAKQKGMFLQEIKMGENVVQKQVFDGKNGKSGGMMGNKELTEEDLENMAKEAEMFPVLNYNEDGNSFRVAGIEEINGSDAYKVMVTDKDGDTSVEYFNVESGLLVKTIQTVEGENGESQTITTEVTSYTEVDGIMFRDEVIQTAGEQTFSMKNTETRVNDKLDKKMFAVK